MYVLGEELGDFRGAGQLGGSRLGPWFGLLSRGPLLPSPILHPSSCPLHQGYLGITFQLGWEPGVGGVGGGVISRGTHDFGSTEEAAGREQQYYKPNKGGYVGFPRVV